MSDILGNRMKTNYETISKTRLVRRMPVIIRIDGCHFHTFTRGFKKPFDRVLMRSMQETMLYLCKHIQGCVLGYTQSDEISLLLIDYKTFETDAWFDNEIQKICSVSASMAGMYFNETFRELVMNIDPVIHSYKSLDDDPEEQMEVKELWDLVKSLGFSTEEEVSAYVYTYDMAIETGAIFDSRCFNIPKEEVTNYFYWRQLDAMRNSVEMVGHANFSSEQLHKKSCKDIKTMLQEEKNIDFEDDFTLAEKRGTCCVRRDYYDYLMNIFSWENKTHYYKDNWCVDCDIPVFKGDGRKYIDDLVFIDD